MFFQRLLIYYKPINCRRGVSRPKVSSPDGDFERNGFGAVYVQSSTPVFGNRRQPEHIYNVEDVSGADWNIQPPAITPPLGTPSDDESETRGHEWTTGAMTERSSISWMDDFDKQTTKTVERMFREIEYALYESPICNQPHLRSTSEALGQECTDWASSFPHMRVIGSSVSPPHLVSSKRVDNRVSTPILMGFQERVPKSNASDDEIASDSDVETIYAADGYGTAKAAMRNASNEETKRPHMSLPSLHSTRSRIAPSIATGTPILHTREDLIRQVCT